MEINIAEAAADPEPSPSPGPPPIPPSSKPEGWQVPSLPLPPQPSKALAGYAVAARDVFQDLADTLGTPEYAVPAPVHPPVNPPSLPSGEPTGLAGFAAEMYSNSRDGLHLHSAVWHGADGATVTVAQRAVAVGSKALEELQDLFYRLRDVFQAANLDRTVPASYAESPSAGGGLESYAEYKLALAVEQTLSLAYSVLSRAQGELGINGPPQMVLLFPYVPEGTVPPQPVPMPQRQRSSPPGVLEV